jgi:Tol biopolymer transport system component
VAKNADEFTWSPDSSEIAWGYVPFVGFGKGLWLAASTGSPKRRKIWNGQLRSLAWAPNGKQIAFSSVRSFGSRARIALIQPDGNSLTYLTGSIAEGFWQSPVRWFPDSKRLLFVGPVGESSSTRLWAVRADGSGLRRLATEPPQSWPPFEKSATISPDGARVAYWVTLDHSGAYGTDPNVGEIFIVNSGGSGKKRYLGHGALGGWSPDGKQLAFAYRGLYVMNATGTGRRKIAANPTDAQWSSRGHLAFTHTAFSC